MGALEKLRIVMFFALLIIVGPFFYFFLKANFYYFIAFIIMGLLFFFLRKKVLKEKYVRKKKNYKWIASLGYQFGILFTLIGILPILASIKAHNLALEDALVAAILFVLGFTMIYYTYKSKKEIIIKNK